MFTTEVILEGRSEGSAVGFTTASFSWDADRLLVCYYGGEQGSGGDFTISFSSTTGLTWEEVPPSPEHVDYSVGDGNVYLRVAKTTSSGSGTITITASETIDIRCVHVIEVEGADLSGSDALDAIVQAAENDTAGSTSVEVLTVTFANPTDADNLLITGGITVITDSEPSSPFTTLTNDYPGSQGSMSTGYAVNQVLTSHIWEATPNENPMGGCAAISIEILGTQAAEPPGWPEAYVGIHADPVAV